jgi:UMF1 family MFS transporter
MNLWPAHAHCHEEGRLDGRLPRRIIVGWFLFDFANSMLVIAGSVYFPQWLVLDCGVSDLWFNLVFTLSSVALLATGPLLGLVADRRTGNTFFLRLTSMVMFAAACAITVSALVVAQPTMRAVLALLSIFAINYGYQLSLVFYSAMLSTIAAPRDQVRVSGIGLAFGWIGGLFGIVVLQPFVLGWVPPIGPAGRIQAFLPTAIIYGALTLLSLSMMRGFRSHEAVSRQLTAPPPLRKSLMSELAAGFRNRNLLLFFVCFFLFSNAITTIQNNSTIYLEAVMQYGDSMKAVLFASLMVLFAVGGVASIPLTRRAGLKRLLVVLLVAWTVVVLGIAATSSSALFVVLFCVVGVLFGSIWNVSRVLFLRLIPAAKSGVYFGVYSSYERMGAILGPLMWSAPVALLLTHGAGRYRIAMLVMGGLLAASILPAVGIRVDKEAK